MDIIEKIDKYLSEGKNKYEIKQGEKRGKKVYQLYINGELMYTDFDKKAVEKTKKNYQREYKNRTRDPLTGK